MDKNKELSKDLQGIVLYSKLKGPHNLNTYSINNQSKKKKETKTKKRIIDNHVSNNLASVVYLGKPLPKIRKNKKITNLPKNDITKKMNNSKNEDKEGEHNANDINDSELKVNEENTTDEKMNKKETTEKNNKDNDDKNNDDIKKKDMEKEKGKKLNSNNKSSLINEINDKGCQNIFEKYDFMSILKNKKEYTVEEVLKLQEIYENENKGKYYKAYPCDDEERMKKYKSFTQLTSKNLNTNTLVPHFIELDLTDDDSNNRPFLVNPVVLLDYNAHYIFA